MKNIVYGLFWALMLILCIASLTDTIVAEIDVSVKSYESKVGESVVIENDTLMIIDYSGFKGSYTLSNGKEISKALVEKDGVLVKEPKLKEIK